MKTLSLPIYKKTDELLQMLRSLRANKALKEFNMLIITAEPDYYEQVMNVINKELGRLPIKYVVHVNKTRLGCFGNLAHAVRTAFQEHKSTFNVALEDDLWLSPDCLDFLLWFNSYHKRDDYFCACPVNYNSSVTYHAGFVPSYHFDTKAYGITSYNYYKYIHGNEACHPDGYAWSVHTCFNKQSKPILVPTWSRCIHNSICGTHCFEQHQHDVFDAMAHNVYEEVKEFQPAPMTIEELLAQSEATKWWSSRSLETVKQDIWADLPNSGFPPIDMNATFGESLVLDFGGGIGRNVESLRRYFGHNIVYYDLPGMRELMQLEEASKYRAINVTWEVVLQKQYHTIFASLVFQHIEPHILKKYLEDLAKFSPNHRLMIRSRWYFDHGHGDILKFLINECEYKWPTAQQNSLPPSELRTGEFHWSGILHAV